MGFGDELMASTHPDTWYATKTKERWLFNDQFRVSQAELVLSEHVLGWGEINPEWILVEPHTKGLAGQDNKDWGWSKWQALADRSPYPLVQCDYGKALLKGVRTVISPSFYYGAGILSRCRGIVTTEGGMGHAAGALRKPAVVIFGAFNRPKNFGYDFHVNLDSPDDDCLGRRRSHPSCRAAMNRISVDQVLKAMDSLWSQ